MKSGTRYCESIFNTFFHEDGKYYKIGSLDWINWCENNEPQYIVLREPTDFLTTSIKTEFLSEINNVSDYFFNNPTIDGIKKKLENTLERFVNGLVLAHYDVNFYKTIYELWKYNNEIKKNNTKLIMLKDLSKFCGLITNENNLEPHYKSNYDFHEFENFISKKFIIKIIKNEFSEHYQKLELINQNQKKWYNLMVFENF